MNTLVLAALAALALFPTAIRAQTVSCTFTDTNNLKADCGGTAIDLSGLQDGYAVDNESDKGWIFYVSLKNGGFDGSKNPNSACQGMSLQSAGVVQVTDQPACYILGLVSQMTWNFAESTPSTPRTLVMTLGGGTPASGVPRIAIITFTCDWNGTGLASYRFVDENPSLNYNGAMSGPQLCAGPPPPPPPPPVPPPPPTIGCDILYVSNLTGVCGDTIVSLGSLQTGFAAKGYSPEPDWQFLVDLNDGGFTGPLASYGCDSVPAGAGLVQVTGENCYTLGLVTQMSWRFAEASGSTPRMLILTLNGGDMGRTAVITFTCDPYGRGLFSYEFTGEEPALVFNGEMRGPQLCAAPDASVGRSLPHPQQA